MKKIKIEKKKKRKKTFDCPIGSLTAAVVSNHRKLPFSNHISLSSEKPLLVRSNQKPAAFDSVGYANPIRIYFSFLLFSLFQHNHFKVKQKSLHTYFIDSINIAMKAARTRTYWTVK